MGRGVPASVSGSLGGGSRKRASRLRPERMTWAESEGRRGTARPLRAVQPRLYVADADPAASDRVEDRGLRTEAALAGSFPEAAGISMGRGVPASVSGSLGGGSRKRASRLRPERMTWAESEGRRGTARPLRAVQPRLYVADADPAASDRVEDRGLRTEAAREPPAVAPVGVEGEQAAAQGGDATVMRVGDPARCRRDPHHSSC